MYSPVFLLKYYPYRNVTPQSTLEFRVWSHHTIKADALLGRATVDLKQALLIHNRKCKFFVLIFVFFFNFTLDILKIS